jgi:hypothetical protein
MTEFELILLVTTSKYNAITISHALQFSTAYIYFLSHLCLPQALQTVSSVFFLTFFLADDSHSTLQRVH